MRASERAIKLIKDSEGLRLKAYQDSAGVWTIGWGHTGPDVVEGLVITEEQAEEFLASDVATVGRQLNSRKWSLTQGQFDALTSFVFNFGLTKFRKSTLFRCLEAGDLRNAVRQFPRWVYALNEKTGKMEVQPGLVTRRRAEQDLFIEGTSLAR